MIVIRTKTIRIYKSQEIVKIPETKFNNLESRRRELVRCITNYETFSNN